MLFIAAHKSRLLKTWNAEDSFHNQRVTRQIVQDLSDNLFRQSKTVFKLFVIRQDAHNDITSPDVLRAVLRMLRPQWIRHGQVKIRSGPVVRRLFQKHLLLWMGFSNYFSILAMNNSVIRIFLGARYSPLLSLLSESELRNTRNYYCGGNGRTNVIGMYVCASAEPARRLVTAVHEYYPVSDGFIFQKGIFRYKWTNITLINPIFSKYKYHTMLIIAYLLCSTAYIQNIRNFFFFRFWYFITQGSFKALFRNTNYVTDQLNKFQSGAKLEPAVHSAR
jgi:hypothetical protein